MRCSRWPAPVSENCRTVADAIAAEVADITAELRRIDQRLAALNWETVPARRTGTLDWSDFCFGNPVEQSHGDGPRQLVGEGVDEQRRGWGRLPGTITRSMTDGQ